MEIDPEDLGRWWTIDEKRKPSPAPDLRGSSTSPVSSFAEQYGMSSQLVSELGSQIREKYLKVF